MRALLFFTTIFIAIFSALAQENPFAEYGYTPKIATLSQGQYNESFDNDSIVQIGSILLNTNTKQVVAFVEYDTMYSEATLEPDIVSRWMSPDPLEVKFPSFSPYNFVANNPIIAIDPDGKEFFIVITKGNEQSTPLPVIMDAANEDKKYREEFIKVQSAFLYLASTKNETAQKIFSVLSKPVSEGGPNISVAYNADISTQPSTPSAKNNPTLALQTSINLTETLQFENESNELVSQSPAVEYAAHEAFGHILEEYGKLAKKHNTNQSDVDFISSFYKQTYEEWQSGNKEEVFHEYFAVKIQNLFAEGLENEPQKQNNKKLPSYTEDTKLITVDSPIKPNQTVK